MKLPDENFLLVAWNFLKYAVMVQPTVHTAGISVFGWLSNLQCLLPGYQLHIQGLRPGLYNMVVPPNHLSIQFFFMPYQANLWQCLIRRTCGNLMCVVARWIDFVAASAGIDSELAIWRTFANFTETYNGYVKFMLCWLSRLDQLSWEITLIQYHFYIILRFWKVKCTIKHCSR